MNTGKSVLRKLKIFTLSLTILALLFSMSYSLFAPSSVSAEYSIGQYGTPYTRLSPKRLKLYRLAAYYYWSHFDRYNQIDTANCKPNNVKIEYGHWGSTELAHVRGIYGAFPNFDDYYGKNPIQWIKDGHCKIYFNLDWPTDSHVGCAVFVHEYGHLLGFQHNLDPGSPMYQGYTSNHTNDYDEGVRRWNRNRTLVYAKTLCNASEIFTNPVKPPGFGSY